MVWKTDQQGKKQAISEISTEVLDKEANAIGEKTFYNISKAHFLNEWLPRLKTNCINIPLKNTIHPQEGKVKVYAWIKDAIGYMYCNSNDLQHSGQQTVLFSSVYNGGNGFYITSDNLWKIALIFSARLLIKHTWLNHNDQFFQPAGQLSDDFKNDCMLWMLFNGKNCTASANDLQWNGKSWSIVNHFIPFTETEVNAPERFESDFMVQYLKDKTLSPEALAVLAQGKILWQAYFAHTDVHTVRDELKLNRADVGWYQIRKALQYRNASGDFVPVSFKPFEDAYKALTEKLQPKVYELGFLKA